MEKVANCCDPHYLFLFVLLFEKKCVCVSVCIQNVVLTCHDKTGYPRTIRRRFDETAITHDTRHVNCAIM